MTTESIPAIISDATGKWIKTKPTAGTTKITVTVSPIMLQRRQRLNPIIINSPLLHPVILRQLEAAHSQDVYDSYDDGYDDVYDNMGDYDEDRYDEDDDYRDGVDDAIDEFGYY